MIATLKFASLGYLLGAIAVCYIIILGALRKLRARQVIGGGFFRLMIAIHLPMAMSGAFLIASYWAGQRPSPGLIEAVLFVGTAVATAIGGLFAVVRSERIDDGTQ